MLDAFERHLEILVKPNAEREEREEEAKRQAILKQLDEMQKKRDND